MTSMTAADFVRVLEESEYIYMCLLSTNNWIYLHIYMCVCYRKLGVGWKMCNANNVN